MKKLLLLLLLFIAVSAKAQKSRINTNPDDYQYFLGQKAGSTTIFLVLTIKSNLITVNFINHKPVAEKPYMVLLHNHSLIIYKRGKKIGAFKIIKKPFELTGLKLN